MVKVCGAGDFVVLARLGKEEAVLRRLEERRGEERRGGMETEGWLVGDLPKQEVIWLVLSRLV